MFGKFLEIIFWEILGNHDILVGNHDFLVGNQDFPLGNRDFLLGNHDFQELRKLGIRKSHLLGFLRDISYNLKPLPGNLLPRPHVVRNHQSTGQYRA